MRLKRNQRGDTLIEVLTCLVMLGFVLGVTYRIAVKAQQTIRSAHERVEALKVGEGQLEQLKNVQKNSNASFKTYASRSMVGAQFCIHNTTNALVPASPTPFTTPATDWNSNLDQDKFSSYPDGCKSVGPGGLYNVSITPPSLATGGLYVVRVRWEPLGSGPRQEVKLEYKLYADQ